jgi:hypothetical protein
MLSRTGHRAIGHGNSEDVKLPFVNKPDAIGVIPWQGAVRGRGVDRPFRGEQLLNLVRHKNNNYSVAISAA